MSAKSKLLCAQPLCRSHQALLKNTLQLGDMGEARDTPDRPLRSVQQEDLASVLDAAAQASLNVSRSDDSGAPLPAGGYSRTKQFVSPAQLKSQWLSSDQTKAVYAWDVQEIELQANIARMQSHQQAELTAVAHRMDELRAEQKEQIEHHAQAAQQAQAAQKALQEAELALKNAVRST